MPITYPRNTESKYAVYNVSQAAILRRDINYPRVDGGEMGNPNIVLLEIVLVDNTIDVDPRLFSIDRQETIDLENGQLIITINAVPRANPQLIERVITQENWANAALTGQTNPDVYLTIAVLTARVPRGQLTAPQQALFDGVEVIAAKIAANRANRVAIIDAINNAQPYDIDQGWTTD